MQIQNDKTIKQYSDKLAMRESLRQFYSTLQYHIIKDSLVQYYSTSAYSGSPDAICAQSEPRHHAGNPTTEFSLWPWSSSFSQNL